MKTSISSLKSTGYGHYRITICYYNGKEYSATTSNMPDVDDYKSDNDKRGQRGKRRLIRWVKHVNNLR